MPEFGVYIHFPFCHARCPYCDFATDVRRPIPHEAYAQVVLKELVKRAGWFSGRRAKTLYFGGGTPGLWQAPCVGRVIDAVAETWDRPEEITIEINPGETDAEQLQDLSQLGITRVSIGVQSLQDDVLQSLGRLHDQKSARTMVREAKKRFASVSCDLIFGAPGQTVAAWRADLVELLALGPHHISLYGLTIEHDTPFGQLKLAGRLAVPDAEVQTQMYQAALTMLDQAGYEHYEISNWARSGHRSMHNQLYWSGGEYLGLGVGAHSRRVFPDGSSERFANPSHWEAYKVAPGVLAMHEHLDADATQREAMWLGLRRCDGMDRKSLGKIPQDLFQSGLLEETAGRVRLTQRGLLVADTVGARFL